MMALMVTLLKGFVFGAVLASPVGPVGILCLKENVLHERLQGFLSSLGIALAYGIVTFLILIGMRQFSDFLILHQVKFELAGGSLLCYLGISSLVKKKWKQVFSEKGREDKNYLRTFFTTFFMTIFNPITFITFTVILTDLGIIARHVNFIHDAEFALSVFMGTVSFWIVLNFIIQLLKKHSTFRLYQWIHYITSAALIVFGIMVFSYAFHALGAVPWVDG